MQTFLLTGTITTRQPLAYSPPDHVDRGKKSLLPRMTVPTAAGPMNIVFVSGSTIRGKLRHACADVYLEREKQQGKQVDYERYLELKVGGVKGSSDEGRVDLRERKAFLEADPFRRGEGLPGGRFRSCTFSAGAARGSAGSTVAWTSAPPSPPSRSSRSF